MPDATTGTIEAPDAVLTFEVRRNGTSTKPALVLVGAPMGAAGFTTLSSYFTDRTVVTYDPRGVERSRRTDDAGATTPMEHADDIERLILLAQEETGGGPVDLFGTSGGAVNALVLVATRPGLVRTLVAHEPPAAQVLPDREAALAAARDVHLTYLRDGLGAGMAKFIALASLRGEIPDDWASRPAPDPARFGLPTEDDGSRDDVMLGEHLILCTHVEHDFDALRAAATRIVVAAGSESADHFTGRAAHALAARLDLQATVFPGGHAGFLGGEYGQQGEPEAFAARLREVLDG